MGCVKKVFRQSLFLISSEVIFHFIFLCTSFINILNYGSMYTLARKNRDQEFLLQEDALLVRGLIAFGTDDVASIRANCLPAKTEKQITNRILLLKGRKRPDNIIKVCCSAFRTTITNIALAEYLFATF